MKKFNLGDYDSNYVMHCETREEAKIFTKFLHEQGLKWVNKESYLKKNYWEKLGEKICYRFKNGTCEAIEWYESEFTILKFSDFDWSEEKTKGDTERILKNFEEVTKILKGDEKMTGIGGEFRKVEFLNSDKVFSGKYEVIELEIPRGLYDEFKEHTCTFNNCRTNVDDYSIREIFLLISEEVQYFKELIDKFNEKYEKKETLEELKEEYIKRANEYKFKENKENLEIVYDYSIGAYMLLLTKIKRGIISYHFTSDYIEAQNFCKRMNEALDRERGENKND